MAEILVCDDDKAIVEAIEIYLSQEGHHILKAYDGEEALRTLRENPVDLLIIDVIRCDNEIAVPKSITCPLRI